MTLRNGYKKPLLFIIIMKNHQKISKELAPALAALTLLCVLLTSCIKSNNPGPLPPTSLVTVIQASPDEPPVYFYLNGNQVNQSPLVFGQGLDYFSAYSGQRTAYFYNAETMAAVVSAGITLNTNGAYSLFLDNTTSKPGIFLLADTLVKPASGDASLRFIDLSPNAPAVNLVIQGGKTMDSNRSFQGYSSFLPINGNATYTFNIVNASTGAVLATSPASYLAAGSVYSIVLEGLATPTNSTDGLTTVLITNAIF